MRGMINYFRYLVMLLSYVHFLTQDVQPGQPCCPESTVAVIHEQLRRAAFGDKGGVDKLKSETGVKDKIAQHWIGILLEKAKEKMATQCTNPKTKDVRLRGRISPEERAWIKKSIRMDIQKELLDWLVQQPEDHYRQIQSGVYDLISLAN